MDVKPLVEKLKTGNSTVLTECLKELFGTNDIILGKELFEALYDLKFHNDVGVKFWAKKVLNKFELRSNRKGSDPAPQEETGEIPEGEKPAESAAPPSGELPPVPAPPAPGPAFETLIAKLTSTPDQITPDDLKLIFEGNVSELQTQLIEFLKSSSDPVHISFLTKYLGKAFPTEEMLMILASYLKHEDSRVVANTVEGISLIPSPKAFAFLAQLLEHPDNRVRSNVALAVGKFDKDQAFSVLEKMVQLQGKTHMQISACHAIMEIKEARFLALLEPLFSDPLLLPEAMKAFEGAGNVDSVKVLTQVLARIESPEIKQILEQTSQKILDTLQNRPRDSKPKKVAPWMF